MHEGVAAALGVAAEAEFLLHGGVVDALRRGEEVRHADQRSSRRGTDGGGPEARIVELREIGRGFAGGPDQRRFHGQGRTRDGHRRKAVLDDQRLALGVHACHDAADFNGHGGAP